MKAGGHSTVIHRGSVANIGLAGARQDGTNLSNCVEFVPKYLLGDVM